MEILGEEGDYGRALLKFDTPCEDKAAHMSFQPACLQASVLKTVLQNPPLS